MKLLALPILLAGLLGACAQVPTIGASSDSTARPGASGKLAPQTRPLRGQIRAARFPLRSELQTIRFTSLQDGAPGQIKLSLGKGRVRGIEDDGCTWQRPADWFSPSQRWETCGTSKNWHSGTAKVRVVDPIYPLKVGAIGVYERKARSFSGKTSTRTTRCEVTDAVEVVGVSGKPAPAFVVECDDGRRTRATWYAPNIGPVAYVQNHRKRGVEEAWQRVF